MLDGQQMQSNSLIPLGNMAQQSSDRPTRLGGTSADTVGYIKTVLAKMDLTQRHPRKALSQHEQAMKNPQCEQGKIKMLTGRTASLQEQNLGRHLSAEEELAHTNQILHLAAQQPQVTQQILATR